MMDLLWGGSYTYTRSLGPSRAITSDMSYSGDIDKNRIVNSNNFPKIFKINISSLDHLQIYELMFQLNDSKILSSFSLPTEIDALFVESLDKSAIESIVSKYKLETDIKQLTNQEIVSIFCDFTIHSRILPSQIVKTTDPIFRGNVGQVISLSTNMKKVILRIWPMIDYENLNNMKQITKKPNPAPFDKDRIEKILKTKLPTGKTRTSYENNQMENCIQWNNGNYIAPYQIIQQKFDDLICWYSPTEEEIQRFPPRMQFNFEELLKHSKLKPKLDIKPKTEEKLITQKINRADVSKIQRADSYQVTIPKESQQKPANSFTNLIRSLEEPSPKKPQTNENDNIMAALKAISERSKEEEIRRAEIERKRREEEERQRKEREEIEKKRKMEEEAAAEKKRIEGLRYLNENVIKKAPGLDKFMQKYNKIKSSESNSEDPKSPKQVVQEKLEKLKKQQEEKLKQQKLHEQQKPEVNLLPGDYVESTEGKTSGMIFRVIKVNASGVADLVSFPTNFYLDASSLKKISKPQPAFCPSNFVDGTNIMKLDMSRPVMYSRIESLIPTKYDVIMEDNTWETYFVLNNISENRLTVLSFKNATKIIDVSSGTYTKESVSETAKDMNGNSMKVGDEVTLSNQYGVIRQLYNDNVLLRLTKTYQVCKASELKLKPKLVFQIPGANVRISGTQINGTITTVSGTNANVRLSNGESNTYDINLLRAVQPKPGNQCIYLAQGRTGRGIVIQKSGNDFIVRDKGEMFDVEPSCICLYSD